MAAVTTSLVVSLTSDSVADASIYKAEFDSRTAGEGGLNNGDTSFSPGDNLGFLLYRSSNINDAATIITPSLGSIISLNNGSRAITEFIKFTNTKEVAPQYPIAGNFTYTWMGNNLGAVSQVNDRKLTIPADGVGVAKITYTTTFKQYKLTNTKIPGEDEYDVLIYIAGETV